MRTQSRSAKPATSESDDHSRRRILTAARRHFMTHGFRAVTMDDLAEELGMSKKTVYAHFSGKAALLQAVLEDKFHAIEADLAQFAIASSSDFSTYLGQLLACFYRHIDEIKPPFVRDMNREAPELFEIVKTRRREVIGSYFGKAFSEGRRQGRIRKDIPVELMIEILLGATEAIMNPPKLDQLGLSPSNGFPAIVTVILEGVVTPRGRERR